MNSSNKSINVIKYEVSCAVTPKLMLAIHSVLVNFFIILQYIMKCKHNHAYMV